jgi:hypothetical protein
MNLEIQMSTFISYEWLIKILKCYGNDNIEKTLRSVASGDRK